jgi:prepilin-type N-terminal cleavage/methylation domain-containing protein
MDNEKVPFKVPFLEGIDMQRNQRGFTLIEITVVLVLMAIISAYVIGRSLNTEQIDLAAQTDRIRNQIRYAQAAAMKQYDQDLKVWGMKCDASPNEYWLFEGQNPDDASRQIRIPGEQNLKIAVADLGVDSMSAFTIFFDRIGKPYSSYTTETANIALDNPLTITISAGGQSRTITVTPETGLVR